MAGGRVTTFPPNGNVLAGEVATTCPVDGRVRSVNNVTSAKRDCDVDALLGHTVSTIRARHIALEECSKVKL